MRTLRTVAAAAVLALSAAACSTSTPPGWTFSPTQQPTPAPSQPSGAPPTVVPGATNPVTGGGQGTVTTGTTFTITAQNIAFDVSEVTVPANTTFTANFDNQDSGIPHNVAFHKDSPTGEAVFTGEIITGPAQTTYTVGGLNAGTYAFVCTVHPNMVGKLTVTP